MTEEMPDDSQPGDSEEPETRGLSEDGERWYEIVRGLQHFLLILLGQSVSQFGSRLTNFVLGVWVYQSTGSATLFSLMTFCILVPEIAILPFAGVLIDRWDRRWVMILSDSGAGMCTLVILWLVWSDRLAIPQLFPLVALSSLFAAFQAPAFAASTTLLVPQKKLVRANGMVELGRALAMMTAPPAAGFLLAVIDLKGVVLIDVTSFLFAVVTLLLSRIPRPVPAAESKPAEGQSMLRDAAFGWSYIRQQPGLLALLLLFAAVNFAHGMVEILLTPLVLSFASTMELGAVLSIAVMGAVVGGLGIAVWNRRLRRIPTIFTCLAIQGMILFVGGVRPSVPLIAAVACGFMLCNPVISACSRTIWQTRVAPEIQGRVFATCNVVEVSTAPLAFLLAGPLADKVFEPMMAPDGLLAGSVGALLGVGPGRGIGLIFVCLGFVVLAIVVPSYGYRPLRQLDEE